MPRGRGAAATLAAAFVLLGAVAPQQSSQGREQRRGRRAVEPTVVEVHVAACEAPNLLRNCAFVRRAEEPGPESTPLDWILQGARPTDGEGGARGISLPATAGDAAIRQLLSRPLTPTREYVLLARLRAEAAAEPPPGPLTLSLARSSSATSTAAWTAVGRPCRPDGSGCSLPTDGSWAEMALRFSAPADADERPFLRFGLASASPPEPEQPDESVPDDGEQEGEPATQEQETDQAREDDETTPPEEAILIESVRLYEVPLPTFTMTRQCGSAPLTVSFQATGAGFPGMEWQWSFGDGRRAAGNQAEHVYEHDGVFTPELELRAPTLGSPRRWTALTLPADREAPTIRVVGEPPNESWLYWSELRDDDRRALVRSRLDGGEIEELRSIPGTVGGIAVDSAAARIYWTETDRGTSALMRADLLACSAERLHEVAGSGEGWGDVAIDEATGFVYWVDPAAGAVLRGPTGVPADDFTPVEVGRVAAHEALRPRGLGLAEGAGPVLWTLEGDLAVEGGMVLRDGAGQRRLRVPLAADVAVHRRGIFAGVPASRSIVRVDPEQEGEDALRSLCEDCGLALALIVDRAGRRLYWIDAAGSLRAIFTTRGTPGTIVTDRRSLRGLALYEPVSVTRERGDPAGPPPRGSSRRDANQ